MPAMRPEQVNAAIASFDRVSRLYEGTWRSRRRCISQVRRRGRRTTGGGHRPFRAAGDAATQRRHGQPGHCWGRRFVLPRRSAGSRDGTAAAARVQFPSSRESATALEWNTICTGSSAGALTARVPVRAGVGGPTGKFRDVQDIAVDRENNLLVATRTGVTVLNSKGAWSARSPCRSRRRSSSTAPGER